MLPLEIEANLTVMVDGEHPLNITGEGQLLTIEIPNRATALHIWRSSRFGLSELQRLSNTPLPNLLQQFDVQVKVGQRVVASTRSSGEAGPIARWLGVDPLQINWRQAINMLLRG